MTLFMTTYRVLDEHGKAQGFGGCVDADTWDEALTKAAETGQTVDGVLGAIVSEDEVQEFEVPKGLTGPSCRWDERLTSISDALRVLREAGHPCVTKKERSHGE